MTDLTLLPINRDGAVAVLLEELPDIARDACSSCRLIYDTAGYRPPWIGYLVQAGNNFVGACAFKGPPVQQRVEIAYFTFPDYEGAGLATAMVRELVAIAAGLEAGIEVIAQTLPEENASNAVLKKLGFQCRGPVRHPEDGLVWEWALPVGN